MTPTYSRYDDHARKARELTEYTDKHGAPYYEKVQGMLREHYKQKKQHLLLPLVLDYVQEEIQFVEREGDIQKESMNHPLNIGDECHAKICGQYVTVQILARRRFIIWWYTVVYLSHFDYGYRVHKEVCTKSQYNILP